MELIVTCICPDLNKLTDDTLTNLIEKYSESHIIVFPEYLLELAKEPKKSFPNQLIFFGSEVSDGWNQTRISLNGDFLSYNKQKLTPWEKHLKPGQDNICIHYKGTRIGLAVCYDIEFPELVTEWRKADLDLLIVPSATEAAFGYERVNRCASARAVELGCAVITCHLIGETDNDLIDVNIGNHHLYLPSQSLFDGKDRISTLDAKYEGEVVQHFYVDIEKIRKQKELVEETNPAL